MAADAGERPTRETADDKRLRILEAARSVCAVSGYEAATMDAVAAEARVSKGTLYNFFDSKEHLFLSTVLQSYDEAQALISARQGPSEDPRARLEVLLDAMVESFPRVAAGMMVNLQVWAVVSRNPAERERMFEDLRQRYEHNARDLVGILEAGRRAGVFRADLDPAACAAGVAAVYDGQVYRSVFDPSHASTETLRRAFDVLIRDRVLIPAAPEEAR